MEAPRFGKAEPIRARARRDCRHLSRPRHRCVSDRRFRRCRSGSVDDGRNGAAEDGAHRVWESSRWLRSSNGHDGNADLSCATPFAGIGPPQPGFSSAIRPSCSIRFWSNRHDRRRGSPTLQQLVAAAPDILGNIVPILAGFKIATTERLPFACRSRPPQRRRVRRVSMDLAAHARRRDFFPCSWCLFPLLFLASGAYLDTQSYRYFVPWYAGLPVAWAAGSYALAGRCG